MMSSSFGNAHRETRRESARHDVVALAILMRCDGAPPHGPRRRPPAASQNKQAVAISSYDQGAAVDGVRRRGSASPAIGLIERPVVPSQSDVRSPPAVRTS